MGLQFSGWAKKKRHIVQCAPMYDWQRSRRQRDMMIFCKRAQSFHQTIAHACRLCTDLTEIIADGPEFRQHQQIAGRRRLFHQVEGMMDVSLLFAASYLHLYQTDFHASFLISGYSDHTDQEYYKTRLAPT